MSGKRASRVLAGLALIAVCGLIYFAQKLRASAAAADDFIEGTVISVRGPEAGVWVIAETTDLPTKYTKIVVTDDRGRYLIPELPKVSYQIFVRGYGLIDSPRVSAKAGQHLDLKATVAPDPRAAAQFYPASYWFSLLKIPQGPQPVNSVIATVKQCLTCHQVGDLATRTIPDATRKLGTFHSSLEIWDRRVQSGPVGGRMLAVYDRLGVERSMFADWTDRIAAGEYPKDAPSRPTGIERNIVATLWDWGTPTVFSHDMVASSSLNPEINSNGKIFGVGQTTGSLLWLDPTENTAGSVSVPTHAALEGSMNMTSPYWGDENIWQNATDPRSTAIDLSGRVWFTPRIRGSEQPKFCTDGSLNKFAAYFPLPGPAGKQVAIYDPKAQKFSEIDTCFSADHNQFSADGKIFYGQNNSLNWIDSAIYEKTHDDSASQGWVPAVLDTNGDGKITKPWTEPDQPIDPTKDHRITFTCYSTAVSPADGSNWCTGAGNTRLIDISLVRIDLGTNPPETARAEIYDPPLGKEPPLFGAGGVDVDSNGLVWVNWRGSDYVTSFDRTKCKVLNGPTATGQQCPGGWTLYRKQGPTFQGGTSVNSGMNYLLFVDRHGVLGLGKDVPVMGAANSDAVLALVPQTGQWITLRIPYPMGFFPRHMGGRIDNPKTGWKGRAFWTGYNTYTPWHAEGGKGTLNKVVKLQIRPDPLSK